MEFPRQKDKVGCVAANPRHVWERFSADYERNLERLVRALEGRGFTVHVGGAGSEDGEYVSAEHPDGTTFFRHLEEPRSARELHRISHTDFQGWLDERLG